MQPNERRRGARRSPAAPRAVLARLGIAAGLLLGLAASATAAADAPRSPPRIVVDGEGSGADLQKKLADAVRRAERIVVTEHANDYDQTIDLGFSKPDHVYASHELTAAERGRLLRAIESAAPQATLDPMCLFSPHHAIEFHTGSRRESRIDVCFTCGQLRWDAVAGLYPDDLLSLFRDLVNAIGMRAEQDWRARRRALGYRAILEKYLTPQPARWSPRSDPAGIGNPPGATR